MAASVEDGVLLFKVSVRESGRSDTFLRKTSPRARKNRSAQALRQGREGKTRIKSLVQPRLRLRVPGLCFVDLDQ